jgi:hypothetical protein
MGIGGKHLLATQTHAWGGIAHAGPFQKRPSIRYPKRNQKQGQAVGSLSVNQRAEEDKKRFFMIL